MGNIFQIYNKKNYENVDVERQKLKMQNKNIE